MRRLIFAGALISAVAALYRRAQAIAEQEERPVADVVGELPGRILKDLESIPDDLRTAAEEGRAAARRAAAEVDG